MTYVLGLQILMIIALIGVASYALYDIFKHRNTWTPGSKAVWGNVVGMFPFYIFDSLGIGCFAPQTAYYKAMKIIPDKFLPGTFNVVGSVACLAYALVYVSSVEVDFLTLILCIIFQTVGGFVGASIVTKLPVKPIRIGLGFGLIVVAAFLILGQLGLMPTGGDATGFRGPRLIVAIIGVFIFGALMNINIGSYAPSMALFFSMGLNPVSGYPIMMSAVAFSQTAGGIRFIQRGAYDRKATLIGIFLGTAGGLFGALVIKSIPLFVLKWVVIGVIIYTSIIMLRSGLKNEADVETLQTTKNFPK
ncbi:MAG: sulfite exporter TauE/SafE family protein [Bacillota bacterium]|nr:sulfite exporter TauE/SafE family protein [Bacillota bacterium]